MATWTEFAAEAPDIAELAEVGTFDAFDVDLLGASSVAVRDDAMFVRTWRPGTGVKVETRG